MILLVEDDPTISDLVAYNLRRAGFDVRQEWSGRMGLESALAADVDLVLLDLMLPGLDGMAVGREIKRAKPDLPIIMLTARGERESVLQGFEAGADDYVIKPFDMDVLLARINARLRQREPREVEPNRPNRGDLVLDSDAHVLSRGPDTSPLKPKEFDLFELLSSKPGHLFTREEIVERVWHHKYLPGSRTLDVHVRRLREKLDALDSNVYIETVRGVGYRLVVPEHDGSGTLACDETGAHDEGRPGADGMAGRPCGSETTGPHGG
jgi:two-component system alkaline phosphatase synthesis response regulator PhoP